ncbi:hypothetical protein BM613_05650 [Sulfoacidibacillus thermotolerans]|uniref:HD-GYP domain-containing protein n=2 Tax=Sulfoacidibacillus thermotolerans TaxID=1765684 RepID=A0A2U3D9P0_SULT2|nr:hypothetical protein BM613_05650 [Sulfoacidibacillus thermotolerans]
MVLGRSLYDGTGRVLLQQGQMIRGSYIEKIKQQFAVVYIEDELSEGITYEELVPQEARAQVIQVLQEKWSEWKREGSSFDRIAMGQSFTKELRKHVTTLLEVLEHTTIIRENLAAVASYDHGTYVHSMNVAIYSLVLGQAIGLPHSMLMDLGTGAMLHDIGKLWVPEEVLNKAGALTQNERELIQNHAKWGHEALSRQHELSYLVAHCAYQHHERMDGSGYPRGLKGDQIHIFGKILAVADVYDAMVMHRPYRAGMVPAEVMEYLFSQAGIGYDLELVSIFSKKIALYPLGSTVTLSDGTAGIVVHIHDQLPLRPVVRIFQDATGASVDPFEIDLTRQLNLTIAQSQNAAVIDLID